MACARGGSRNPARSSSGPGSHPPPNQDSRGPQPCFLGWLEAKCLRRGRGEGRLAGFHPWGGWWEIRLQSRLQMQLEEGACPACCLCCWIDRGGGCGQPPGQPCRTGPQINDSPIHEAHSGGPKRARLLSVMGGAPIPTLAADRLLITWLDPDGGGLLGGHGWTRLGLGGGGTPPPSLYVASMPRTPFSNYVSIAQELPDGHLKTRLKSSPRSPSAARQTVLPACPSLCAGKSYTAEFPGDSHGHVQPRPDSRTFSSPQNQAPFLLARRPVPPATSQQLLVSVDLPVWGVHCDSMGSSVSASFAEHPLVGVHPRRSE